MSTRINVTVGDGGLLDRNAQQTAANRQARVLADQRATAEAEGVERRAADRTAAGLDPLTGLPASTPSSASTINRLDQEPAANRRGYYHLLTLGATATGSEASQPESQSGSFLHLRRGAEFQPHQLISDHASRILCYYCTPASITEITTPTAITELFEAFIPRIPDSTGSYRASAELTSACPLVTPPRVTITIPGGGFNFAGQTFLFRPNSIQQFDSGYAGYGFGGTDIVYTPYVYEVINSINEFTSPTNIKSLPATLKWGMPDGSTNSAFEIYRTSSSNSRDKVLEAYADPRPFRYAVWPQRGEFPDIDAWEEGYEGPRPIKVPQANQPKSEQRPPRTGPYDVANRLVVTDWNDPGYCRARLQDLGFNLNQLA
jgi:hypothetical protein